MIKVFDKTMRVGNHFKEIDGSEYVVAQIFEFPNHTDFEVINCANGAHRTKRVKY